MRWEGGDPFPDEPYWLTQFVTWGNGLERVICYAVPGHGAISLRELVTFTVDRASLIQEEQQGA